MKQNLRIPGLRWWRRKKGQLFFLLFLIAFSSFFMEFTYLFSDSLQQTIQSRREDAYGEWQIAMDHLYPQAIETVKSLPSVVYSDVLFSSAVLADERLDAEYILGGFIEKEEQLAHLRFQAGEMPQADNEVALEASLAKKLGLSDSIGQTVEFSLKNLKGMAENTKTVKLRVCGIFDDYAGS